MEDTISSVRFDGELFQVVGKRQLKDTGAVGSDNNPNLAIFRQTDNGLLVRMALFALVLDVVDKVDEYSHDVRWYNSRQN